MCLGYRLALFEIKAILIAMIRSVKFEPLYYPTTGLGQAKKVVEVSSTFAATLQPHLARKEDEKIIPGVDMSGPWLPVRTRLVDEE